MLPAKLLLIGMSSSNYSLGTYYEGIGVLLKNGFIDAQPVADLLGTTVTSYWEKLAPLVMEFSVKIPNPRARKQSRKNTQNSRPNPILFSSLPSNYTFDLT